MEMKHFEKEGKFVVQNNEGQAIGEIVYRQGEEGVIHAVHTVVLPSYGGQGIAAQLVDALAKFATEKGLKIIPNCSYVERAFGKEPERFRDVMK